MYLKVTRKTKAEFDKDLQDEHNEYLRREAEFKAKIPQLIKEYMAKHVALFRINILNIGIRLFLYD